MYPIYKDDEGKTQNDLDYQNFEILDLSQVADKIKVKDIDAVQRWCQANDVSTFKFTKKYFVYKLDFEYALGKPFVMHLIKKHPDCWKEVLRTLINWDALYQYFLFNFSGHDEDGGVDHICPADERQEKLFKRLMK